MLIWDPHIHFCWYKPDTQLFSTGFFRGRNRLGSQEAEAKCWFPSRTQLAVSKCHTNASFSAAESERSPEELSEAQLTKVHVFVQRYWLCRKQVNPSISYLSQWALKSRCNPAGLPRRGCLILLPPSLPCSPTDGFLTQAGGQIDPVSAVSRLLERDGNQERAAGAVPGAHSCSQPSSPLPQGSVVKGQVVPSAADL